MDSITPPDLHYLNAAQGWLGLGNPTEAKADLNRISPAHATHPDVLAVRWQIHAKLKNWDASYTVAQALVSLAPDRPSSWVYLAFSTRRLPMGGLKKAWKALRPAGDLFPDEMIIPYNLAYYACKMGLMVEAERWLKKAISLDNDHELKKMALQEPGLKPLWPQIRQALTPPQDELSDLSDSNAFEC
jgi:tetratricopeptide (TPR) repeat protein